MIKECGLATPETQRRKTIIGIWLIPITSNNKIFVVENLIAKPQSQKVPGQLNCPAETYNPSVDSTFIDTLKRASEEEIGFLDYQPKMLKALGLIRMPNTDEPVVAVPYLIPVESESSIIFMPKDYLESRHPRWVRLEEIDDRKLNIGRFEVPMFRSPMQEIVQLIRDRQAGRGFQVIHSREALIPQEVFDYLQSH